MLLLIIFLAGCKSKYIIIKESAPGFTTAQYNNIYAGWLDLDESKWQDFRYESVDKWKVTIHEMNVLGLQKFLDVSVTSSGTQWNTIEARLDAIVYNLAEYLSKKLKG